MVDLCRFLERHTPVTWLFCGDSITQGAVHTRGWRDYTQLFKERLGELARNDDLVLNTAVGGWSVSALLPRLQERILRLQPDVLFLLFGTNDAAAGPDHLATFSEQYVQVIERARRAGIGAIVVQTTVPMLPVDPEAIIAMAEWPDAEVRASKLQGLRCRRAGVCARHARGSPALRRRPGGSLDYLDSGRRQARAAPGRRVPSERVRPPSAGTHPVPGMRPVG